MKIDFFPNTSKTLIVSLDLKIDFSEYVKKHIRILRIRFENSPAKYLGYSGFLLMDSLITPCRHLHHAQLQLLPSHHSYPHHTRCPQHTTTATPITPDATSTQPQLPTLHHADTTSTQPQLSHHTRYDQYTNT